MPDHDDTNTDDGLEPDGPVTEGVRIIGAQEAGTGTPSEEAEPERPRRPVDPDLPMVRISSTDVDAPPSGPDRFGAVPIVRPGSPPPTDEPRDAGGHARLVDLDDEPDLVDEEGFVLPHWTDPPTGQVPKVVIGDEQAAVEATPATGPRWRDEGERSGDTDFDDLVEDAPQLGSLDESASADDFFGDDPFAEDPFAPSAPVVDVGADAPGEEPVAVAEELPAPSDEGVAATSERPRRSRRPAGDGDDGSTARPAGSGDRNLPVAAAVGVGLIALALVCFKLGGFTTLLLTSAVVGLCALEYFTAVRARHHNPATLLGLAAVLGLLFGTYFYGLSAYPVVLALTTVCGLLWYLWVAPGERGVLNLGLTMLGVMWIGFLGSFATLFLGLGRQVEAVAPKVTSNPGIGVLLAAIVVSVSHDVGAYFVGRKFGSTPLSAASPNKTQEGLAGGVVVALVVTTVVVGFGGIDPIGSSKPQTFVFALLCSLAAPLGDLCESFVKRDLKIKDMGSVLPGHGGVLDRFDSLLFVLPTAYLVTVLFDTWSRAAR